MTPRTPCYAWFVAIGACLALAASAQGQPVLYVDGTATGANDGSSWCDAYLYLQDALAAAAASGGVVTEIRVAQGIYTADRSTGNPDGTGDREATFQLLNGVALRGGYAGCGAPDPDERDIALYETILSGDLDGDDSHVFCRHHCAFYGGRCIDGFCIIEANNSENSYHVVTGSYTDETAVLDGFTIAGGNANGAIYKGAGMFNEGGSPTVANCKFIGNSAHGEGGGIHNQNDSSPTLTNCTFTGNTAQYGGGISLNYSSATLTDCTFTGNTAYNGGGMAIGRSSSTVVNCTFTGNLARRSGGAIYSFWNSTSTLDNCTFRDNSAGNGGGVLVGPGNIMTLTNCSFRNNSADISGGGMYCDNVSSSTLTNCTFSHNLAGHSGGGMYGDAFNSLTLTNCTLTGNSANVFGGGVYNSYWTTATVGNCILWANVDDADGSEGGPFTDESAQFHVDGGSAAVNYTCTQGLISGGDFDNGTNIGDDPLFVPGPADCYYLSQIAAGQAVDSPSVDAGDPTSPLVDGTTRSDEVGDTGIGDMGYHYPITGKTLIMGDFDRDQRVDLRDFAEFQQCFTGGGATDVTPCCRIFDFEADADVDLRDLPAFESAVTGP